MTFTLSNKPDGLGNIIWCLIVTVGSTVFTIDLYPIEVEELRDVLKEAGF